MIVNKIITLLNPIKSNNQTKTATGNFQKRFYIDLWIQLRAKQYFRKA